MSIFLCFTDIIWSPEERMNKSPSAPWLWLHDYIITLISWMHYSEKSPLRAKQTNTSQYVPPRSPSNFMKVSLLPELQSFCDTISTNHPHPARQLQPGTTSCFKKKLIYIFMFFSPTAVARTPEARKALLSDSRRKWTKNVILNYVRGKRWSWELEGRKTGVRLFLFVWGHAARTRVDTCRCFVCLQVCSLCVWGAALCDVYIHVLTLITVTFHTGKGASWDVTSKDQHTK